MITIDQDLAFRILDVLGPTPLYALMGSDFEEELPQDFKPEKWTPYAKEHAEEAVAVYRDLLAAMEGQVQPDTPPPPRKAD